jgi:hypothetical protein
MDGVLEEHIPPSSWSKNKPYSACEESMIFWRNIPPPSSGLKNMILQNIRHFPDDFVLQPGKLFSSVM